MTGKILIILRLPFLLFYSLEQVAILSKKINQDVFEFQFEVGLYESCFIIQDNKNYPALLNQCLIDYILLVNPYLCFYCTISLIANNYLLGICCFIPKKSFKEKFALKSIPSLCSNLKLLYQK